jgi:hypothetical protein
MAAGGARTAEGGCLHKILQIPRMAWALALKAFRE